MLPVCLFLLYIGAKCHGSLQCPLAEYYWSAVVNVPLLLSASVDKHLARWPLRQSSLDVQQHLLLLYRECTKLSLSTLTHICARLVMHACSSLVKHPKRDLTYTLIFTVSPHPSLQAWTSQPPETCRWNRILTPCKLAFLPHLLPAFLTVHACISLRSQISSVS